MWEDLAENQNTIFKIILTIAAVVTAVCHCIRTKTDLKENALLKTDEAKPPLRSKYATALTVITIVFILAVVFIVYRENSGLKEQISKAATDQLYLVELENENAGLKLQSEKMIGVEDSISRYLIGHERAIRRFRIQFAIDTSWNDSSTEISLTLVEALLKFSNQSQEWSTESATHFDELLIHFRGMEERQSLKEAGECCKLLGTEVAEPLNLIANWRLERHHGSSNGDHGSPSDVQRPVNGRQKLKIEGFKANTPSEIRREILDRIDRHIEEIAAIIESKSNL